MTRFSDPRLIFRIFSGLTRPSEPAQVTLRKSDLRFNIRGKMDIWSLKETFIDRFYERFGTPIGDGWNIIDVGAGIGDYTIFATYQHPRNQVYAYEPFAKSFDLLRKNLELNLIENAQTYAKAVFGHTGALRLNTLGGEPLQIRSEEASHQIGFDSENLVPSLSLADVLISNRIEICDLLKLDCEGAEFDILFNAKPETLSMIKRIVMEFHDGVTGHNHGELADYLRKHGFQVQTSPNYVHDDLGYLYAEQKGG